MLLTCTTRGCLKQSEAKLNKETNEVICDECGNAIEGVTKFMKKSLESSGQILRNTKKQAFQALCPNCHKNQPLVVRDNKAFCKECDTQVQVSAAFLQGLKLMVEAQGKVAAEPVKAKKVAKKDSGNE